MIDTGVSIEEASNHVKMNQSDIEEALNRRKVKNNNKNNKNNKNSKQYLSSDSSGQL